MTKQQLRKAMASRWTITAIADRFEEAVSTLRRLPPVLTKGYFNNWPPILRTAMEQMQSEKEPHYRGSPSPEAISRMEETIEWIFLLDDEDERRLVWLRAARVPWKPICARFGCGRTKAWHMWVMALLKIVTRLDAERNGKKHVRT